MIVDHLCYGLTGGAAIAALRIHDGLRKRGIESRYWHAPGQSGPDEDAGQAKQITGDETGAKPTGSRHPLRWPTPFRRSALEHLVSSVTRTARDLEVKIRHLRHRPDGFEYFSTGKLRCATPWPEAQLDGDVLVLHWIGKLIDYPSFFGSLPKERPVVWVLHDMNPFTGGCHFSAGCDRFTQHCGNCPQIAASADRDITFQTLRMKRRLYDGLNLHVVAPSQWLSAEAQRSVPFASAASHRVIPYGLNTDQMKPVDRDEARRALGLDANKQIVLFGAASSENRRKGFHCLLEAWSQLPGDRILGVMFGAGEAPKLEIEPHGRSESGRGHEPGRAKSESRPAEIRHLGFLNDPDRLRLVYSAADLFVLPSLEDNLPQTGMEAMCCGTPVVAFAAGGIPDYVRPEETGLLAPTGDSDALAGQIRQLLERPEAMRSMGLRAREMMVREYSQPIESARYEDFLASLVRASNSGMRAA